MAQNCKANEYRSSIHAGSWYPGKDSELKDTIQSYLNQAGGKVDGKIIALVAPHAGYDYSGPVAAFAYKTVQGQNYDDVIVIGPSHHYGFSGASIDIMAGRVTPLGKVEYDLTLARKLMKADKSIRYEPAAHEAEHSTEIQIPFLQTVLTKFQVLEIVMGTQDYPTCQTLSDAIAAAVKGRKVLIVASSDLSHYHGQAQAESLDNRVVEAVADFDPELLNKRLSADSCEACGGGPIVTALLVARKLGATRAQPLVYATSGNVTGDYRQVVGYLAAAIYREEKSEKVGVDLGLSDKEKVKLKSIARDAIEAAVKGKDAVAVKDLTEKLKEHYGIFVTIKKGGDLRGCIGRIIGDQPVYLSCQQMARAAALEDPRFDPVTPGELAELEIEISVLTPLAPVRDFKDIVIGRDGLLIRRGYASGLLLPQVATEYGWNVTEFLEQTCHKAGLPKNAYQDKEAEIYKFSAEVF
jgi:AmmeMemoRadiSam system protein B/AmmeMemoRadiSam system protein A